MSLASEILNGEFDEQLDNLTNTISLRKKALAQIVVSSLVVGDSVMIKDCRPKLLIGQIATVKSITSKGVLVKLPYMVNRKWSEAEVTVPASMIEKV